MSTVEISSKSILESAIEHALETGKNVYVFHVDGIEAFTDSKQLAESMDTENNVFTVDPVEVLAEREYHKAYAEAQDEMCNERWCFRCDSVQHECFCDDPIYSDSADPAHVKFLQENYPNLFDHSDSGYYAIQV